MSRLRCNSKAVKLKIVEHIRVFYPSTQDLFADMRAGHGGLPLDKFASLYQEAKYLVESANFLVWNDERRAFLKDILEQSQEEADRYSEQDVDALYEHLIAVNCEDIILGRETRR